MKLKNLVKFYKMSKNWEIVNGKVSIPDHELEMLDIRAEKEQLLQEYNPNDSSERGQYMPDMTQEDFDKWQAQKSGWQKFYDKVLGK